MLCRSFEAIDITAAFARAAMLRTEAPDDFAAGLASAGLGSTRAAGVLSATCSELAASFFAVSTDFGAGALVTSASFDAAAAWAASATLDAFAGGAVSAARDGTPCGSAAAKRSSNMIEAEAVSGFDDTGCGGNEANTSSNDSVWFEATGAARFTTGAS